MDPNILSYTNQLAGLLLVTGLALMAYATFVPSVAKASVKDLVTIDVVRDKLALDNLAQHTVATSDFKEAFIESATAQGLMPQPDSFVASTLCQSCNRIPASILLRSKGNIRCRLFDKFLDLKQSAESCSLCFLIYSSLISGLLLSHGRFPEEDCYDKDSVDIRCESRSKSITVTWRKSCVILYCTRLNQGAHFELE
jgi:hypothetical protein